MLEKYSRDPRVLAKQPAGVIAMNGIAATVLMPERRLDGGAVFSGRAVKP
jgi:hypothetical protein